VFVSGEVETLRSDLSQNPSLKLNAGDLANAGWGDPQTLLLVGDDQRSLTGEFKYYRHAVLPHSNEMLLVRIDPSKPWISMMSIPRELQVTIYPKGQQPVTTRLNYAYTAGGIPLLVSTIKRVLGLPVNHVMVITFGRFKRAVNEMGCVYSTIDRRYYHVNVPGGEQYQEINLQPGYQDLCGSQALQFVSYRHGDTSLVRDARDQSFLLDVKKQYGPTLADNAHKFEHIFGQAVQTDPGLHSTTGILNLLGTLISSSARRVRQVHFQANLLPTYDTANAQQIQASVNSFLNGVSSVPKRSTSRIARAVHRPGGPAAVPVAPVPAGVLAQARTAKQNTGVPYEFPRVQDRGGAGTPPFFRGYLIHAPDGTAYQIYDAVFATGQLGQFYDVQGSTWTTAPFLDSPEQTVSVGGRKYFLYYEGSNLNVVAWYEHGAVYWVRNTLTDAIGNAELLTIAERTQPLGRIVANGPASIPPPNPTAASSASKLSTTETIGSVGGLVTLVAVPLLSLLLLRRRRQLGMLREQLSSSQLRQDKLTEAVGGARAVAAAPPARAAVADLAGNSSPMYPSMRIHTVPRRRLRRSVVAALLVAAVAGAGAAVVLVTQGGHASSAPTARHGLAGAGGKTVQIPTVPVAVLNSSATAGAAHRMAQRLTADGVKTSTVGNLAEPRPAGLWVLYQPGEQPQAQRLAALLPGSPKIAPVDPTAQAAAGSGAAIVVVIA
jgi:polyisoprenyl-teichoic acid--peptidoglycan teichoic acid transferase